MAAPRQGLSDSQVEKAFGPIQYLSSMMMNEAIQGITSEVCMHAWTKFV